MMKMKRIINANTQCGRIANPTERLLESDFDKVVKRLKNLQKGDDEEKEEGV